MRYKSIIAGLLIASFFSFVFISTSSAATTFNAIVTADTLYVRSGPGKTFSKVGKLKKGVAVKVYEQKNNWSRVSTGKKWVTNAYLKKTTAGQAIVNTAAVKSEVKSAPANCMQAVKEANSYCASIAKGCSSFSKTEKCLAANKKCEERQEIALSQCPQ